MKKRKLKKEKKRVRRVFDKWMEPLGLLWWTILVDYNEGREDFQNEDNTEIVCNVQMRWEYLEALITVNVGCTAQLSDAELERSLVHELVHILIAEMQGEPGEVKHQERVVTLLTKAFFWVRVADQLEEK